MTNLQLEHRWFLRLWRRGSGDGQRRRRHSTPRQHLIEHRDPSLTHRELLREACDLRTQRLCLSFLLSAHHPNRLGVDEAHLVHNFSAGRIALDRKWHGPPYHMARHLGQCGIYHLIPSGMSSGMTNESDCGMPLSVFTRLRRLWISCQLSTYRHVNLWITRTTDPLVSLKSFLYSK